MTVYYELVYGVVIMPGSSEKSSIPILYDVVKTEKKNLAAEYTDQYLPAWERVEPVESLKKACVELKRQQQEIRQDLEAIIKKSRAELNKRIVQYNYHIRGATVSEINSDKEKHQKAAEEHYKCAIKIKLAMDSVFIVMNEISKAPKPAVEHNPRLAKNVNDLRQRALRLKQELAVKEEALEKLSLNLSHEMDKTYVQFFQRALSKEISTVLDDFFKNQP